MLGNVIVCSGGGTETNRRITLFGCNIDNVLMEETLRAVKGFVTSGQPHRPVRGPNAARQVAGSRADLLLAASSSPMNIGAGVVLSLPAGAAPAVRRYFIDDMAFLWLPIKEAARGR